ncbi:MAG TPA: VTT domain-containing protein [Pilimelia sp.]|nr:VTT domain-containing protein [Pilimelia sp.]
MTGWLAQVADLPTALVAVALSVVMLLDAIPLVGVLVPGDVAVLAAMGARGPASGAGVLAAVVAGCLAGWSVTFAVGRRFGDRLRHGRVGRWIGEARWAAAERAVRTGGGRVVVVAPFLPVLNALVPLAAGGLHMSYRRFLLSAALGAALWSGSYVALGALAAAVGGLLPDSFALLGTVAIGLAIGGVALVGARRRFRATPAPAPVLP